MIIIILLIYNELLVIVKHNTAIWESLYGIVIKKERAKNKKQNKTKRKKREETFRSFQSGWEKLLLQQILKYV